MGQVIKESDYPTRAAYEAAVQAASDSGRMVTMYGDRTDSNPFQDEGSSTSRSSLGCLGAMGAIGLGLTAIGSSLGIMAMTMDESKELKPLHDDFFFAGTSGFDTKNIYIPELDDEPLLANYAASYASRR